MTAVTGKPTAERIKEYLHSLHENGIEQILLYPRSGCELEYLSEEWFSTVGNFITVAEALDMSIWLYDDFNWPSGDACGRVTAIEEYRLMSMKTRGEHQGRISCKSRHNSGLFGEKYFPNLLSHGAVDYFIKCTHEEYYRRFGKYFGGVIKGMFTDEASVGYCSDGSSIPYYTQMADDYKARYNRDLYKDMRDGYELFYYNAIDIVSERFDNCYVSKIKNWCHTHGIAMTGHFMSDASPFWSVKHNGRFLKNLKSFTLPGIDEIDSDFTNESEMSLFGVAEYVGRERGAMAERFALGPCEMSYAKKRCMIYLAACHKIDNYFLAISPIDMRGNMLVTDFFNCFTSDQPDFSGMRLLSEEAKIATGYAKKDYIPDVYVRYPTFLSMMMAADNPDLSCLVMLINMLTRNQIQWKYADEGDSTGDTPVIELNSTLGFTLDGSEISPKEICDTLGGKITVKDAKGDTPAGIFVRKFTDGSMLILNLFAPEGEYTVNGRRVYLCKHGVTHSLDDNNPRRERIDTDFHITYCNPNMIRLMYINDSTKASVECPYDTRVRLAIRNDTYALVNGKRIEKLMAENSLPDGIKELYYVSTETALKAGNTVIESAHDYKYMPSVFLIGDFCAEIKDSEPNVVRLMQRSREYRIGNRLYDYGKIELTAEISVPKGASALEIKGTELYTTVHIEGALLGESIAAPYVFKVDKGLWDKKISLKITQYTSMGAIFGNVDYWDKNAEHSQWRGTPSTGKTCFGFDEINWIY